MEVERLNVREMANTLLQTQHFSSFVEGRLYVELGYFWEP